MTSFLIILLVVLVGTLHADPGDAIVAIKDYTFGPLMYLVIALGMIACLYQFARGEKAAGMYILAGVTFIAVARSVIPSWFTGSGSAGSLSMGEFPYYGQTPAVQVPGEVQSYADIKSWGYLGLMSCHALINLVFSLGLPVIIASAGAMITFKRLAMGRQAGSVVGYFLLCIVVGAFCLFPVVTFSPGNPDQIRGNDVITSFNAANANAPANALTDPTRLAIPILPALLLTCAVDLTEAIGGAINAHPASSFPTHILTAARHAALPDAWLSAYARYSAQCAAAQAGFLAGESGNATAVFSQNRMHEGTDQAVAGSSLNLLSSWGDAVLALIPLHGYVINDRDALAIEQSRDPETLSAIATTWKWVPSDLSDQAGIALLFNHAHLNSGLPAATHFWGANYQLLPPLQTPVDQPVWTLPRNLPAPQFPITPAASWIVPFCSVPDQVAGTPITVTVNRTNGAQSAVTGWPTLSAGSGTLTTQSDYLTEMAQAVAMPTAADGSANVAMVPYDWGEELRTALLQQYDTAQCLSACGNPAHKFFWGCLVTGAFIQLSATTATICDSAADTTRAFFGQSVDGSAAVNYAQVMAGGYYQATTVKSRSIDDLASSALGGASILSASPAARRAAVDAIMGAPGTFAQNSLARDAFSFPAENGDQLSLWNFFARIPQMAMWLLAMFATIAAMVVSFLWPHVLGIVMLLLLLAYPVFACLALWPAKWVLLLEWARGLMWVSMWAPVATLGYSLINSGSYLTQEAAFLSATPGPGQTLLTLLGSAMILMAPAIAQALITPSFAALVGLGSAVYGTAFKVLGIGTQLTTALASAGAGALGAGIGAGTALVGQTTLRGREPTSAAGGGRAPGPQASEHASASQRLEPVIAAASTGSRLGLAAGRQIQRIASAAFSAVEPAGTGRTGASARTGVALVDGVDASGALASRMVAHSARSRARFSATAPAHAVLVPAQEHAPGQEVGVSGAPMQSTWPGGR